MICPNHLLYSFEENMPCERCIKGSKWNCLKYGCIHNSKVKSLLGVMEGLLYSALKNYRLVDLYICPSVFLEKKLQSASTLYEGRTYTIHNFIEKTQINRKTENEAPYVAFAGRLSREKGVELLAEVAKRLPDCHFVVAGSGPDDRCLQNIPNLELKGFLTGDALTSLMANAQLLLVPSVWYENCPLSILEAHSMGVPVVALNSGGMAELIEDGKTGTLAKTATGEAMAKAVEESLEKDYYRNLKNNCEKMAQKILDVEAYCQILISKYNELLQ